MPAKPNVPEHLANIYAGETDPEKCKAMCREHNDRAQKDLDKLTRSITQGEWLHFSRAIDIPRPNIESNNDLTLLAMAYFKDKREHGRSSLDLLLDFNDEELMTFLNFAVDLDGPPKPPAPTATDDATPAEHAGDGE